jgi:predicted phage-related endonuclease
MPNMSKDLEPLRAQVAILRFVKAKKAELALLESNARAAIEELLGDDEEGTLDGAAAVRWKTLKRTSLNQKLLKELHPEVAAECQDTTEVRRFELVEVEQ